MQAGSMHEVAISTCQMSQSQPRVKSRGTGLRGPQPCAPSRVLQPIAAGRPQPCAPADCRRPGPSRVAPSRLQPTGPQPCARGTGCPSPARGVDEQRPPANRGSKQPKCLDVVVQVEFVRVRAQADLADLFVHLVLDVGLDEVLGEHAAFKQELVVVTKRLQRLLEAGRDRR